MYIYTGIRMPLKERESLFKGTYRVNWQNYT